MAVRKSRNQRGRGKGGNVKIADCMSRERVHSFRHLLCPNRHGGGARPNGLWRHTKGDLKKGANKTHRGDGRDWNILTR